uniref:Uncharacterized protein n=1 Tax=Romanomermis culicivorax TaxID=13658 RepID=A0A915I0F5_ROMCU
MMGTVTVMLFFGGSLGLAFSLYLQHFVLQFVQFRDSFAGHAADCCLRPIIYQRMYCICTD